MEDTNSGTEDNSASSSAASPSAVSTESTPVIEGSVPSFPPPSYEHAASQVFIFIMYFTFICWCNFNICTLDINADVEIKTDEMAIY